MLQLLVGLALAQSPDLVDLTLACEAEDLQACRVLGGQQLQTGDTRGAIATLERNLALTRAGNPEARDIATWTSNLASAYATVGELDRATALCEEALAARRASLGRHTSTAGALERLADLHRDGGHPDLAIPLLVEALDIRRAESPDGHPSLVRTSSFLIAAYLEQGDETSARPLLESSLATVRALATERHAAARRSIPELARQLAAVGEHAVALELVEEFLDASPEGPSRGGLLLARAQLQTEHGSHQAALQTLDAAMEAMASAPPAERARIHVARGRARWQLGQVDAALEDLWAGVAGLEGDIRFDPLYDLDAQVALAWALIDAGSPREARRVLADLLARVEQLEATRRGAPVHIALAAAEPDHAETHLLAALEAEGAHPLWRTTGAVLGLHAERPDTLAAPAHAALGRHPYSAPPGHHIRVVRTTPLHETLGAPGADTYTAAAYRAGAITEVVSAGSVADIAEQPERLADALSPLLLDGSPDSWDLPDALTAPTTGAPVGLLAGLGLAVLGALAGLFLLFGRRS